MSSIADLFKGQKCKQDFKIDWQGTVADDFKIDFYGYSQPESSPSPLPIANFGYAFSGSAPYLAPVTVNFTDVSIGTPTSWLWNFGDGSTSTAQNPSHIFQNGGTYDVSLTVFNSYGESVSPMNQFIVVQSDAQADPATPPVDVVPPVASFTASVTQGAHPLTVQFTDTSTGSPTAWTWTFGNAGASILQNPSFTFEAAGTYVVNLLINSATGASNTEGTHPMTITVS